MVTLPELFDYLITTFSGVPLHPNTQDFFRRQSKLSCALADKHSKPVGGDMLNNIKL